MHDLIPLGPALPGTLTVAEIDATMRFAEQRRRRPHGGPTTDWRDFAAWCAF